MADRGFQIKEELPLHFCSLEVPLGSRIKRWLLQRLKKPKMWLPFESMLKLQLIVSKVLENALSVSLLQHIDDILWTFAALCNLKPKLVCSKKKEGRSNI